MADIKIKDLNNFAYRASSYGEKEFLKEVKETIDSPDFGDTEKIRNILRSLKEFIELEKIKKS
jgi:hypothetical protein